MTPPDSSPDLLATAGRGRHIMALDGLRGLAILLVYFHHYGGGGESSSQAVRAFAAVKSGGWVGVDLFFVLSGFLITGILLDSRDNEDRARTFYIRRALRIFPVFYATALGLLLLTPVIGATWRPGHAWYLLYGQNIAGVIEPALNVPSRWVRLFHLWSLAVEEQFYLVWPLLVWRLRPQTLLKFSFAVVASAWVGRAFIPLSVGYNIFRYDALALGSIVAIAGRLGIPYSRYMWLMLFGIPFGLAAFASGTAVANTRLMLTVGVGASGMMFTGLLIAALERRSVAHILSAGWLRVCGRYSYGMYLFSGLWLDVWLKFLPAGIAGRAAWFGATFAFNIAFAATSYHLLERPFLRMKDRFAKTRAWQNRGLANVGQAASGTIG